MKNIVYNHNLIEKKWQKYWEKKEIFKTNLNSNKPKYYILDMFPYPSGAGLHVGHPEGYTATDIVSRMMRMKGYEVLHPMGWDAFGLPAEQYAIQTGNNPRDFTNKNIKNFKLQLKKLGFSYDWTKEINTTDPKFYKWTQWIFAQLYKNDLVELKNIEVNWSPSLNTVLANEEVIKDHNGNDISERDLKPVIKKEMEQWVLKITKYADRIFKNLDNLDWPDSVKKLQKNWIYEKDDKGNYSEILHLKDWIFARQRYWGEPFPIIHFDKNEIYLIPESEYPILLPKIKNYKFSSDGKPALSKAKKWIKVEINGKKGTRDLNTMPQWAGSCWYYIAYILRKENEDFVDLNSEEAKKLLDKWLPVDLYIGGQEHATLHLMYARFWHLFLYDIGITNIEEPFKRLFNQGMILGNDSLKMSKSRGNIINPNLIIKEYGADTLRLYEMFMGSLEDQKAWSNEKIHAMHTWLERVYRLFVNEVTFIKDKRVPLENKILFNNMLKKIDDFYIKLKFNVAISEMMIFINGIYKNKNISLEMSTKFLQILSCIAPHIADEIYYQISNNEISIFNFDWPDYYNIELQDNEKMVFIQINGKIRAKFNVDHTFNLETLNNDEVLDLVCKNAPNYCKSTDDIKNILIIKNKIISINI